MRVQPGLMWINAGHSCVPMMGRRGVEEYAVEVEGRPAMPNQLQITLHGLTRSEALEEQIRRKAARLERVHGAITSCRVVVERPHKHHHQGGQFVVRLHVSAPGADIVVNHDHSEDVHVALRDAFDAARRQLEDHVRRRDGGAKSHQAARTARKADRADRT